ncbi:hypothetical protein SAMN04490202_3332 [Pseudomonas reinekei]|uniref:Protein FAM107A/FAM107B n=1 Tax=Pseudomonas reinekei TaxID=395598 RepID=A0A1H0QXM5_PSERE|nr:hypothetical protein [Pseudomonas reinekei]KAB0482230.1 protein FAM107A/FAM107B [Pseudomonas reinekei]OLU00054.1 hypothetical protein BVK86_23130 [Pseudomonas reinekei]SDP21885.1 hypothetical protein SAMN04490202_3332 [Pseudomonas reinekei]
MTGHDSDTALPQQRAAEAKPARKQKPTTQAKPIAEIISQVFVISVDKDQNIKPATLSRTDFKAIVSCQTTAELDAHVADKVAVDARKTDPQLNALALMAVATSKCREGAQRHALMTFCVRLASALWINRHRESHDLFQDILDSDKGLDATPLRFLCNAIAALYSRRIEHVRAMPAVTLLTDSVTDTVAGSTVLTPTELAIQRDNLLLIGGLWLLANGKSDPSEAMVFFTELLEKRQSRNRSNRDVALYLAEKCAQHESLLADTLDYFKQRANEQVTHGQRLQSALERSEQEAARLKTQLAEHKRITEEQTQRISAMEAEISQLQHILEEQQLDERAKRTHLRDNTGQVKARAFNLLTENVLEPLKLSLSALQREKPKTEVAAHHIELAVESIGRDIQWFKE